MQLIYGGSYFTPEKLTEEEAKRIASVLASRDIPIDAARLYAGNEEYIGNLGLPGQLKIHTKLLGFAPGVWKKETILQSAEQSRKALRMEKFDVLYIHTPDYDTANPLEEALDAVQILYEKGYFKELGISNYTAELVEKHIAYAKSKGYVLPTVFQGLYNIFSRKAEEEIFPTIRKYGIRYYAYSPLAGGIILMTPKQLEVAGGRWERNTLIGDVYRGLYAGPNYATALKKFNEIQQESGIPALELGYRWVCYHSGLDDARGDGIVFGCSKASQFPATLAAIDAGPLPKNVAEKLSSLWDIVRDDAKLDPLHAA